MIIINNKEYTNYNIKVSWGEFSVSHHGKRRKGIAPFITFNIDNDKFVGLEFIFSDEMFKQMKVNIKTNIKEYISDVLYEDKRGWVSIINSAYDCYITRIDDKNFEINFNIKAKENISIDSNITLF